MSNPAIQLREAQEADARMLWEWANDPQVRAAAYHEDPISWEQHTEWLKAKLEDVQCTIYIADAEGPIGQVRFDRCDGQAEIDIHLAPSMRGQGLGYKVLSAAVDAYLTATDIPKIVSEVKADNQPSLSLFRRAGFKEEGLSLVHGTVVYVFSLDRS
jgi:UDP-2,4-diacetamido-2,4,6-trideoxy-beta-L-altropyranose hydrolase